MTIITAAGRLGSSYLLKKFFEFGKDKFTSQFGTSALDSILMLDDNTINQEFELYKNETEKDKDISRTVTDTPAGLVIGGGAKEPLPPPEPFTTPVDSSGPITLATPEAEEMDTTLSTPEVKPVDTTLSTPIPKESSPIIFTKDDTSKQTEKALQPKVEYGALSESEKQTAKALMGEKPEFYSRVVKSIEDAKPNKLTKNKWKSFIQSDKQELKFLGLDKYLQGNESITKQELLDFVEQKNIADKLSVVKVPTEDQYDFTQFSLGGASSARATRMLSIDPETTDLEGYKSSVKQYVFQVDGPAQWSADPNHFPDKYAKNAIAHARAQIGYFDPDAVEKRLNKQITDSPLGKKLNIEDKTLLNASKKLKNTFIIDEIQSDIIQKIQKRGTIEDYDIVSSKNIIEYLDKNNIKYKKYPVQGFATVELKSTVPGSESRTIPINIDNRFEIFTKDGRHGDSGLNIKNIEEANNYFQRTLGIPSGLPIIESKKYVELVLNSMIKEATDLGLDSIGITNGQIQYDRYDGQREDKKEGLKKFYDETVFAQFKKIADKYNVELETITLPYTQYLKEFEDVGLNEPTEISDAQAISSRIVRSMDNGFVIRKIKYGLLASTIEDLVRGRFEDPERANNPNATLPDYTSIFTDVGNGQGGEILDILIDDNLDLDNEKSYYMWVKPNSPIDKALQNDEQFSSLSGVWDTNDIDLQMPIALVEPSMSDTDVSNYSSYMSEYFKNKEDFNIRYNHEIIKMKLPKKLQKDILSKPIKLTQLEKQTNRLLA